MESYKLVIISTAHLQQSDAILLDNDKLCSMKSDGAYLVFIDRDDEDLFVVNFSDSFKKVVTTLRDEGYGYVLFDRDGIAYDDQFEIFDW